MAMHEFGETEGFLNKPCDPAFPGSALCVEDPDASCPAEEGSGRFRCEQCGRCYRHAGSLANHKKTHEVGSFQCPLCTRVLSNALALKNHLRIHTCGKNFACSVCGKAFRLATQLATHQKVHSSLSSPRRSGRKEKNLEVEAPEMRVEEKEENGEGPDPDEQEYGLLEDLPETAFTLPYGGDPNHSHLTKMEMPELSLDSSTEKKSETEDPGDRPFKCDQCDRTYRHHGSLINHKKSHLLGVFECPVCYKQFNNLAALNSHQRTHTKSRFRSSAGGSPNETLPTPQNEEEASCYCQLCEVAFPNKSEFQDHILLHNTASAPHDLSDSFSASTSDSSSFLPSQFDTPPMPPLLDKQEADDQVMGPAANSQMYTCAYCGEGYPDLDSLKVHYSTHDSPSTSHPEGGPLLSDSEELGPDGNVLASANEAKAQQSSLGSAKERRFTCQTCGKSYLHAGSLINHKRSHQTGVYQCSICCKHYPHLAALHSHLRSHRARPPSLPLSTEGDWLSPEPLTLEVQQGYFHAQDQEGEDASGLIPPENLDDAAGYLSDSSHSERLDAFHEQFPTSLSQGSPEQSPLPGSVCQAERHMCADCGETYADIAGIRSHLCPRRRQHHETLTNGFLANLDFGDEAGLEGAACLKEARRRKRGPAQMHLGGFLSSENSQSEGELQDVKGEDTEEEDGEMYQCSLCGNHYHSLWALRSHLRSDAHSHGMASTTGPSSQPSTGVEEKWRSNQEMEGSLMICSTCGESFCREQDLLAHQLLHGQAELEEAAQNNVGKLEEKSHICGDCGMFCTGFGQLQTHDCKGKERPLVGEGSVEELNGEVGVEGAGDYKTPGGLWVGPDSGDRPHRCDQCGRTYRHPSSLLNHKKSHKTGVFRCLVCQKRFYNLLALKSHHRTHFDLKRHKCEECGKAYKMQKQLLNHLRTHEENRARAQQLDQQNLLAQASGTEPEDGAAAPKRKTSKSRRRQTTAACGGSAETQNATGPLGEKGAPGELQSESEETKARGPRPYACEQCGRTYRHAGSLVNHKKSHKMGKYYCNVCNSTYSNQLAMKNHLRIHLAAKKYSCLECGKAFRGPKQLSNHSCGRPGKNAGSGARGRVNKRAKAAKEAKGEGCGENENAAPDCGSQLPAVLPCRMSALNGSSEGKEERPFVCDVCNRSYRHAGSLLNHKNTHKTGDFSCSFCSKPFSNAMALRNHTRIHTQKKKHVCGTCGKAFRLASVLLNHQKTHTRGAARFSCTVCSKSFLGKSGLKRHRCQRNQGADSKEGRRKATAGSGEGGECRFTCEQCGRSYRHASSLLNHKNTHTTGIYHCTLCLKTFSNLLALKNHRRIHSEVRRHCCPDCGKMFRVSSQLRSHRRVHAKQQELACAPCQRTFPSRASFRKHQELHSQHDSQQLPLPESAQGPSEGSELGWGSGLDLSLMQAQGLDPNGLSKLDPVFACALSELQDQQEAGPKVHVCEHCGRTYRHASSLLNHKNSHKTGFFACSICQKEFSNLMALKNHRRIHTEPKRYVCPDCGKAFRVSTQLICHQRVHTKEKPFSCPQCGKCFSSKSNLRHHQKVHRNSFGASLDMGDGSFLGLSLDHYL